VSKKSRAHAARGGQVLDDDVAQLSGRPAVVEQRIAAFPPAAHERALPDLAREVIEGGLSSDIRF